ncbi:hypothetical protein K0M31_007391 [Melipona bicolor]|uniref:Uncharacterized protein n=1 Tax=Melipona bicolor TaxID=60889 RepID=A0AA40KVR4_9HYME|nr:hypothetical protein K0M31_007391 [Melipona bicolor]
MRECIVLEEVARLFPPLGGSPDTEVSFKNLKTEYLVNEKVFLTEGLRFVSGEHGTRRGGTTFPAIERFP